MDTVKMLTIADLKGKKPHFTTNGNIKLGNMAVWSTMKGSDKEVRYINDFGGNCSGTCGKFCKECTKSCYVNRSYRYGSVLKGHAVNTIWLKEDLDGTFKHLENQLTKMKKKPTQCRVNQSGELTSGKELKKWIDLAKKFSDIHFYLYTKNYEALNEVISNPLKPNTEIPNNITILISVWHDVGVACYNKYKDLPYIKAFVYDDGEMKLKPDTYCKAYNEKGKLNHSVTCDICKKCFNRNANHKIIGCKAH